MLTPLEAECKEVLLHVREALTPHFTRRLKTDYMELMHAVKMCLSHLINKEYGCNTGKHAGRCECAKGAN